MTGGTRMSCLMCRLYSDDRSILKITSKVPFRIDKIKIGIKLAPAMVAPT